jgi:single-strand DNA-binding protein
MAAGDTQITIVGNLVDDPELRFTSQGHAVVNFRIASTPRVKDKDGAWRDGESLFLTCNVWRQAAENCAESLQRGMRVIVQGRLKQRSYETREGEKRTVYEIEADDVGPSLKNATAKVTKAQRQGGGFGQDTPPAGRQGGQDTYGGQERGGRPSQPADDPWATSGSGFSDDQPPPF